MILLSIAKRAKIFSLQKIEKTIYTAISEMPSKASNKRHRNNTDLPNGSRNPHSSNGIVEEIRRVSALFYPREEISNERCDKYISGELERPFNAVERALTETARRRSRLNVGEVIVHWFKRDLRIQNNRSLFEASRTARAEGVPLVCVYIFSPQDYDAFLTSACRVEFELQTLEILKKDLSKLNIPLSIQIAETRTRVPEVLVRFCKNVGSRSLFCNLEYEVDELRREAKLVTECINSHDINMQVYNDTCIVCPGVLSSKKGTQYTVFTPWYKSWLSYLKEQADDGFVECFDNPSSNDESVLQTLSGLFDSRVPDAPVNKSLPPSEKARFQELYPAGEHEAVRILNRFISETCRDYSDNRDFPARNATSLISPYLACGALSARTAINVAIKHNNSSIDSGAKGIVAWIRELAWRDFYKHILVQRPYVCMNKPFKLEYSDLQWEQNYSHFRLWTEGKTGYPIVDAAMRQLNKTGYMHNRCRMITASFLAKHLMLDWRLGEKFFMSKLIDGDFASNNGGWGFSSSTGVDSQPYFRMFNPTIQSKKFDPDGEYIKLWVPELSELNSTQIHSPYDTSEGREIALRAEYPEPIVEHTFARNRALARYRAALGAD
ncbi:DNA photolyase, FAD-binding/Cryptochrome [Dipodascopsis uninucleata]